MKKKVSVGKSPGLIYTPEKSENSPFLNSLTNDHCSSGTGYFDLVSKSEGDSEVPLASSSCLCGVPNRPKSRPNRNRIVGGKETKTHEYPWQVTCYKVLE